MRFVHVCVAFATHGCLTSFKSKSRIHIINFHIIASCPCTPANDDVYFCCVSQAAIFNWTDTKISDAVTAAAANRRGFAEILAITPIKEYFEETDAAYQVEFPEVADQVMQGKDTPAHEPENDDPVCKGTPQKIQDLQHQVEALDAEARNVVASHKAQAKVLVKSLVHLVILPEDENDLYEQLRHSTAMKLIGNDRTKTHVMIHYDMAQASECLTQAKHRIPGLRKDHYKLAMNAIIRARWSEHGHGDQAGPQVDEDGNALPPQTPNMVANDVFTIYDGGKQGRDHTLYTVFVDNSKRPMKPKSDRAIHICYSQADLLKRMERDKGAFLDLSERIILVSATSFTPEERPRLHWQELGTTRGNTWGPVKLPDWENSNETWLCTNAQKEQVLANAKWGVGGANPAGPSDEVHRRSKDDIEPLFWHARTAALHDELLHTVQPVATFDLTPGDGLLALKHIERRTPYVGVAFNKKHAELLMARLQNEVFHAMSSKHSKLQETSLITALGGAPGPAKTTKQTAATPPTTTTPPAANNYLAKIQAAIAAAKHKGGAATAAAAAPAAAAAAAAPAKPKPTEDDEDEPADSGSERE